MLAWPVAKWLLLFFEVCCVLCTGYILLLHDFCNFCLKMTGLLSNMLINKTIFDRDRTSTVSGVG